MHCTIMGNDVRRNLSFNTEFIPLYRGYQNVVYYLVSSNKFLLANNSLLKTPK